jgi:hypothetical protein
MDLNSISSRALSPMTEKRNVAGCGRMLTGVLLPPISDQDTARRCVPVAQQDGWTRLTIREQA